MSETENNLLMPFYDESKSFTNGFECGILWQRMENGEIIKDYLFHACNVPQLKLMEKYYGYAFEIKVLNEDWVSITSIASNSIPKMAKG